MWKCKGNYNPHSHITLPKFWQVCHFHVSTWLDLPAILSLQHSYIYVYHLATIIEQSLPQPMAALLIAILLSLQTPALKPLAKAFKSNRNSPLDRSFRL